MERVIYLTPKRKTQQKKMSKTFTCPSCHGTVHAPGRTTVEAVREVHESTCPAALRLAPRKRS